MNLFRSSVVRRGTAVILIGLVAVGVLWLGSRARGRTPDSAVTQIRSLGPTVSQLEKIGELASMRVHVTDVLTAEGEGYRGSWLIKGDALLSCDVSRATIVRADAITRTATLRLPQLRVTSCRVDHEKTKTWSVEQKSWLPWSAGNQGAFRDAAMYHAQQLIEAAALSDRQLEPARLQTELIVRKMYELVEWKVNVVWE